MQVQMGCDGRIMQRRGSQDGGLWHSRTGALPQHTAIVEAAELDGP